MKTSKARDIFQRKGFSKRIVSIEGVYILENVQEFSKLAPQKHVSRI